MKSKHIDFFLNCLAFVKLKHVLADKLQINFVRTSFFQIILVLKLFLHVHVAMKMIVLRKKMIGHSQRMATCTNQYLGIIVLYKNEAVNSFSHEVMPYKHFFVMQYNH